MTDTTADTTASVNGQAPAPEAKDGPCTDCVTGGEKALALIAALFGVFVVVMAFDMFTGGRVSGLVRDRIDG
ncbi:MAG TPA: hypothetical protein VNO54_06715 [Streptosporangiaceae bacterium]|nr:hypothetical protein [Streptosporangiaceae bacterium]